MLFQRFAIVALSLIGFANVAEAQPRGVYSKPTEVTGNTDWWVPNHRSPCPAMNTLANHGYINRNGKDLTPQILKNAIKEVFNVDDSVANFVIAGLPNKFTLADLSKHNFIEHDASLVHADSSYKINPMQVDGGLANDLFARGDANRELGVDEVGMALRVRLIWCQQKQGGCDFGSNQRDVTFREAAKLIVVMGAQGNNKITLEHAYSFLVDEKIPEGWTKSRNSISLNTLNTQSVIMQRIAGVST